MKRTDLSKSLSISSVVQGFWRLGSWDFSVDELLTFMHECIDRGVTTFDTAEIYSRTLCETKMGEAFAKEPELLKQIELVSKTGITKGLLPNGESFGYYDTTGDRIRRSCRESLKRLNTDHLDLYLIHREDPCFDPWETGEALLELKQAGLVREIGVSNFDPVKFDVLNKVVDEQLVTNQIEWNPVCFEHFNSGLMDYLTYHRVHPMIWSPLAGGRMFDPDDELCARAMHKIEEIAADHGETPETIIYAWIMYHPVGAVPLSGSNKILRLENAIRALDVKLERYEWFEIYAASGQQIIR